MNKILLQLFVCLLVSAMATAQTVKGTLKDRDDNSPLEGATVSLVNKTDSAALPMIVTSAKSGRFIFYEVPPGEYNLTISSIGYDQAALPVTLIDSLDLGVVNMVKGGKVLKDVIIVGSAPPVRQKTDTVEYSANSYKVNPDANAEDLIKKMPGITVDNGTVTAHGENVKKVTVDGREFFGDDATAALRNLPSEVIDKIQVFDKLSDQAQFTGFEDANSVKTINIVTKANMRNGQFGRVYGGYGTNDRYSAGGNVSFFKDKQRISLVGLFNNINQQNFSSQDLLGVTSSQNRGGGGNRGGGNNRNRGGGGGQGGFGGNDANNFLVGQQSGISRTNAFGVNYSNVLGKLTLTGSYFFNNSNTPNNETINRHYVNPNPDSAQVYNENGQSNTINYNNRVNLRAEYKIDSFNSLIFTPTVSFQNNTSDYRVSGINTWPSGDLISKTDNDLNSKQNGYNINNGLLFRHAFSKRGRTISLNINDVHSDKKADTYLSAFNTYALSSGGFRDSTINQLTDNTSHTDQYNFNIAYSEPVGKKGQLMFNYNPSFSTSKAFQANNHLDADGKYTVFDTSLSNKFTNRTNKQNGGVTFRRGDKDNQFSVGVAYQHTNLNSDQVFPQVTTIDKNFVNILPSLMLRLKLDAKNSLRVMYRTSTTPPAISQLQNVINNTNQFFYSTGNPDLKQQYTHSFITRYTYTNSVKGQSFFANIFLQSVQDYIANATYTASKDSLLTKGITLYRGSQISKPVNLNGFVSARSFLTFGTPIKFIKSNLNLNAGFTYTKQPGFVNNVKNVSDNYTYTAGAVIASNISQYVDFTVSYSGNFNRINNTLQLSLNNHYYNHSLGASLNLLSKQGWFIQTDVTNQLYSGLSSGYNQDYWLWNGAIGKKFFKDKSGEIRLSVFDILKQNNSITRNTTESYVEDVKNTVLSQYFMLTFSYKLKNFVTRK